MGAGSIALLALLAFIVFEIAYLVWSFTAGMRSFIGGRELTRFEIVNNTIIDGIWTCIRSVWRLITRK